MIRMKKTQRKKIRRKVRMMVGFSRISVSNSVKVVQRRRGRRIRKRLSRRNKIHLRRAKLQMLKLATMK